MITASQAREISDKVVHETVIQILETNIMRAAQSGERCIQYVSTIPPVEAYKVYDYLKNNGFVVDMRVVGIDSLTGVPEYRFVVRW